MKTNRINNFKRECIDLYSEINLESLLDKMASHICHYLDCQESAMFLYNSIREELNFRVATGKRQAQLKEIILKKGEGLVGWVAEHQESVIVDDCRKDSRVTSITDQKINFITHTLLAVPVYRDNHFLGVLEAVNKNQGKFNSDDQTLLEAIAQFISIPIQNALLFEKVIAEANEKAKLIELAKIVSSSFNLDEIFNSLKNIISEFITPLEINFIVKSQKETHQLIPQAPPSQQEIKTNEINETTIAPSLSVFPLRSHKKTLGLLEIKTGKKIPPEIVSLFKGLAVFAAISIEKHEMYKQMLEKEKLEKELDIARQIQQQFLPQEEYHIPGIDVAYINIPSSMVGGDYFDIVKLNDNETIFTINDISGHGIPASLVMSIFSANFTYRIKKDNHPLTTINHLNDLIAETTEANMYVTSFTGLLDRKHLTFDYINAGHNPPFLFRTQQIIELQESQLVLGMFPSIPRTSTRISLQPGDWLLLYTDGLIEAENPDNEQFSPQRLKTLIQKHLLSNHPPTNANSLKTTLVQELTGFVGKNQFTDDITFVIISITGEKSEY